MFFHKSVDKNIGPSDATGYIFSSPLIRQDLSKELLHLAQKTSYFRKGGCTLIRDRFFVAGPKGALQ